MGSHKTHLLAARTVDAARRGFSGHLLKWHHFSLAMRATYQAGARESEMSILARYAGLDYLAVDDLGVGRVEKGESDAAVRLAFTLFDMRYDNAKTTDIATNLTLEEVAARFDERIGRRIAEMTTGYPMLLSEGHDDA
ncbi:MAG: hypothetical protein JXQ73_02460 [Phycisphaerae bacterium]|nr:hypothetical protein [Phycisphaerae bacterium]